MSLKIVRTGIWLYDGTVEKPVDIIALEYDWWYSLAFEDGQLEDGEEPISLGPDCCLYYARFRRALDTNESTWVDSKGYQQLSDAMKAAEEKVMGGGGTCSKSPRRAYFRLFETPNPTLKFAPSGRWEAPSPRPLASHCAS